MRSWLLVIVSGTLLAGCSGAGLGADGEADAPWPTMVDALAAYNAGQQSANMERLGQWGERGDEIDACDHWLFVDAGATVQILDMTDPANPVEVADVVGLPDIQDVKSSDDCQWLFVGNDQEGSAPPLGGVGPLVGGIYVVDVSDKANPSIASHLPVGPRRGPHMVYYFEDGNGRELVFGANADVSINEFDRDSGTLRELARYQPDLVTAYNRDPEVFDAYYQGWTHDMVASVDPGTGESLLYTASWDAGLRVVDIDDPSNPVELGGWNEFPEGHEGNIHTVATDWIDGRSITVGAVEV
ncbi:MAG TPA: hypothetical protein VJ874_05525, partial [Candidatus Thermoplasmatota archaeon]|nr:hypothetical protein [Candidatus Thermoplasmatota archaeon]